ncbi:hypothetical protein HZH68_015459 [Vespula germanica]|uniref:Uncharacterized protein n=1 Tax=Vespula germanica TaxID=30212 RepID=A0A834J6W7_VESGE|nr:hypothetical protein HZH68_015459 [Vespula germanica]
MDFRSEIGLCEDEIDYIKILVIKKMKAVIETNLFRMILDVSESLRMSCVQKSGKVPPRIKFIPREKLAIAA